MNIPKKIKLAGFDIDIILDDTFVSKHNCVGRVIYEQQLIIIDPTSGKEQFIKAALIHEILHYIFYLLGRDELRKDEALVDSMSYLILQALESLIEKEN